MSASDPPVRRKLEIIDHEPWFSGWCHWEIRMTLEYEGGRGAAWTVLASGRWKWRGRRASMTVVTGEMDVYLTGTPVQGPRRLQQADQSQAGE